MKKFIPVIINFILLILLFGALELTLRQYFSEREMVGKLTLRPSVQESYLHHPDLFKNNPDARSIGVFVVGTSHLQDGVLASELEPKGYNFSRQAMDLYYASKVYDTFIDDLPNVRYLIIGLDPIAFGFDSSKYNFFQTYFYKRIGIPLREDARDQAPGSGRSPGDAIAWLKDRINLAWLELTERFYLLKYREEIPKAIYEKLRGLLIHVARGQQPASAQQKVRPEEVRYYDLPEDERQKMLKERMINHIDHMYHREDEAAFDSELRAFIQKALKKNLRILLLTAPVTSDYWDRLPAEIKSTFDVSVGRLKKDFSRVDVLNLQGDPRFDRSDFRDPDHLNLRGARVLTSILNDYLASAERRRPSA